VLDITQLGGAHFRVVNVELGVSYHFVALVGAGPDGLDLWSAHFTVFRVSTVNCSTNLVSTTPSPRDTNFFFTSVQPQTFFTFEQVGRHDTVMDTF
jgi:hypothetical protein